MYVVSTGELNLPREFSSNSVLVKISEKWTDLLWQMHHLHLNLTGTASHVGCRSIQFKTFAVLLKNTS